MLKAYNDVVFLDPYPVAAETKGGLVLPTNRQQNDFPMAKVVAIGPGIRKKDDYGVYTGERVTPEIQVGDSVIYDRRVGAPIVLKENVKYFVCRVGDLLAVAEL